MENAREEVLIIGLDEQGIFLSLLFAKAHYQVVAFDVNKNKTNFLQKGYYDKRIEGLSEVFSLYKENIFFSSDKNWLKKDFQWIIVNQLKKSEWEILDELSYKHSPYFILTEPSSILINETLYKFLNAQHKKAHVLNWPMIRNQSNMFLNVFYPSLLLIGCREDEEHLAMHFLIESLYSQEIETLYTNIETSLKVPLVLENYYEMLNTFFKDQLSEMMEKEENNEDLIYVLEKLNVMKDMSLFKKSHSNSLTTPSLLIYEKETEEKIMTAFTKIIHRQDMTKIAFLGIEPPFDVEKNYVLKLIKLLAVETETIWFYDDEYLTKAKECLKPTTKIHYAIRKEELLKHASIVVIGSSKYSQQNIAAKFTLDLNHLSIKRH
ncbi:MAG: hypothetical protein KH380_03815 [Coprobacillus sp.]|nr:hypothetical protein [Coprobacillus sp.]